MALYALRVLFPDCRFPCWPLTSMTIRYVSGDLFTNRHNAQAFAHGCNCRGATGAGIAKGFRERYPDMYEEYLLKVLRADFEFTPGLPLAHP